MDSKLKWIIAILWSIIIVMPSWIQSIRYLKKVKNDHTITIQNHCMVWLFIALCASCVLIVGVLVL